jgi:predicted O-methyltransferase YrrM
MSDKPFEFIQSMTRQHRADHGCGAYTFEDGPGLTALAATHRASRVLELGTALGYTGCCLAAAASNTHLDSIEMDVEHVRLARENIARAGLSDRVRVHQGDFMAVTDRLPGNYDWSSSMGLPQRCAYFGYCTRSCETAAFWFARTCRSLVRTARLS